MASSSSYSILLILLILCITMVKQVASRPSPRRPDSQILKDLFGSEISSLLMAQPEVTEGSAQSPVPSETERRGLGAQPSKDVPRLFLDFLSIQRKLKGRSRKSSARGCFGMKVDRIGALSGLGC
ncbi:C-type natriuretic peptide 2 [Astyanax mexicanus]|uniref:C-type natriuretic peptide 2-like n=2 Tax=Astyanax mexicanus TaxID=7994 RepID=A0A8T2LHJ8_ASTMX|nr:C-type natriuretic peptide 2 [Astyanax mexicanus]KAG9269432.1 C-type natriuretic peptide 2-like [Astyanax mexicanus]